MSAEWPWSQAPFPGYFKDACTLQSSQTERVLAGTGPRGAFRPLCCDTSPWTPSPVWQPLPDADVLVQSKRSISSWCLLLCYKGKGPQFIQHGIFWEVRAEEEIQSWPPVSVPSVGEKLWLSSPLRSHSSLQEPSFRSWHRVLPLDTAHLSVLQTQSFQDRYHRRVPHAHSRLLSMLPGRLLWLRRQHTY